VGTQRLSKEGGVEEGVAGVERRNYSVSYCLNEGIGED
jgi:hypothetical protein